VQRGNSLEGGIHGTFSVMLLAKDFLLVEGFGDPQSGASHPARGALLCLACADHDQHLEPLGGSRSRSQDVPCELGAQNTTSPSFLPHRDLPMDPADWAKRVVKPLNLITGSQDLGLLTQGATDGGQLHQQFGARVSVPGKRPGRAQRGTFWPPIVLLHRQRTAWLK